MRLQDISKDLADNYLKLQCRRYRFDPWVGTISWRREMAAHSSTLAWRIPWTEEPGGLKSMRAPSVGDDSAT